MARLMQAIYLLPGKEQLTLVGEWALARPQPRYQVLEFPALATGTYEDTDYDYFWRMGHVLQGPYGTDVQTLWTRYLVRPNGECNLALAYMTAYSIREVSFRRDGRFLHVFNDRIKEALDDNTVTGDKRVTWLLARAFADEVMLSSHPLVSPRSQYLSEARLVAESSDYKFWTLREIAARYASLGDVDNVNKTVGDFAGETPDQQVEIAAWRSKAAAIAAANAKQKADDQAKSKEALIADAQRRLTAAQQQQNPSQIARYQKLIESLQTNQTNP
jgi:hypothetical protein